MMIRDPGGSPPEITPEVEAEVRRRIASAGGQAFRRSVEQLRERAALGDRNAQNRLASMARIARANGKRGGRPKGAAK